MLINKLSSLGFRIHTSTGIQRKPILFLKKKLQEKMKEERCVAERGKGEVVALPFSGPPAFDLSTSCHACCLPVHPSLVQIKSNSTVKKKKITGNKLKRIQVATASRRGPVSGSRLHPDTGDPWQVVVCTVKVKFKVSELLRFLWNKTNTKQVAKGYRESVIMMNTGDDFQPCRLCSFTWR